MGVATTLLITLTLAGAPDAGTAEPTADHPVLVRSKRVRAERVEALKAAKLQRDLALVAARTAPAWPRRQLLLVPTPAPVPVEELELPALAKRCAFQATEEGLKVVCVVPKVASSAEPG